MFGQERPRPINMKCRVYVRRRKGLTYPPSPDQFPDIADCISILGHNRLHSDINNVSGRHAYISAHTGSLGQCRFFLGIMVQVPDAQPCCDLPETWSRVMPSFRSVVGDDTFQADVTQPDG
jgi:hypothetical protein